MQEYIYLFVPAFIANYLIIYINKDKIDFSLQYQELKEDFINRLKSNDFIEFEDSFISQEIERIRKIVDNILLSNKVEIKIKDYLLEKDLDNEIILNIILKEILPDLNNFLSLLYSKISEKTIDDILYFDYDYINSFSNKIIKDIKTNELFENINFFEIINEIKIKDFFKNTDNIKKKIFNYINELIKKDFFKDFIKNIVIKIFDAIKKNSTSIINFINPNLQVKLYFFLENNLILLLNSVKSWIKKNKVQIDSIIENTIEEHFQKQELVGQIKLIIKDFLGLKVSETFNIVEKIILQFENYFTKNATSDFIETIINFLETKNLNDIINLLNLDETKTFDIVYNFIVLKSEFISESISNYLLNMSLDKFIKFIYNKEINISNFLDIIFKSKINDLLENNIQKLKNYKLKSFFTEEKFNSIKSYLPFLLMFGQGKIKENINKFINEINYKEKIISNIENQFIFPSIKVDYEKEIYNILFDKFEINKEDFLKRVSNFINKEEILSFYKKEVNKIDKNNYLIKQSLIYSILFDFINIHINNIVSFFLFPINFYNSRNINNKILNKILSNNEIKLEEEFFIKLKNIFIKNSEIKLKEKEIFKIIKKNIFINEKSIYENLKNKINSSINNLDDISLYLFKNTNFLFSDLINKFIKDYINNKKISDLINIQNIIDSINIQIDNYDLITEINNIKDKIKNYDFNEINIDKYIDKDFKISEYFYIKKKIDIDNYINNYINNFFIEIIKNNFINNELAPENQIRNLFNGELIKFIKSNINKITKTVVFDTTINKLKKEKENIIENIIKNFQEYTKENVWYDLGNSLFDIEEDIKQIINILIEEKLSSFFTEKELEIENIINSYIELLSYKKLEDIGISEETLNLEKLILIINDILSNLNLDNLLSNIINNINFDISINKIINTLGFENLNNFFDNKKILIIKILNKLENIIKNANFKEKTKLLLFEYINKNFSQLNLKDLFDDDFLNKIINKMNEQIKLIYYLDNDIESKIIEYSKILEKNLEKITIKEFFIINDLEDFSQKISTNFPENVKYTNNLK